MPEGCNEVSKCVSISYNVRFLEGQQGASHDVFVCQAQGCVSETTSRGTERVVGL